PPLREVRRAERGQGRLVVLWGLWGGPAPGVELRVAWPHTTASCLECERRTPVLIAMAGLPGSGKSTIAACLEKELGAVVLNKDRVRAALFPPRVLDYSQAQDDITMAAIYQAAAAILRADPGQVVILDGRTFLLRGQVRELLTLASSLGEPPRFIECRCDDAVAKERLERD